MTDQQPSSTGSPEPSYAPVVVGGRRRGRVVLALAIVGVVIAAAFGFSTFAGSGDGAGSAEDAVRDLFDAIAKEDAIGVLEAIAPEERSYLRPAIEDLNAQLSRLGIIGPVDLSKVPGFDVTVDGLRVATTDVADGISRVQLTGGTVTISTKPSTVPTGDVLKKLIEANGGDATVSESTSTTDFSDVGTDFLVAVKRGGDWFVSLAFTIAEQARNDSGREMPAASEAVSPIGAGSPEAAVRGFLQAAAALDVRGMIARTPPDEMGALQRYAALFLPDAENAIDGFKSDSAFGLTIDNLDLSASDVDGGRLVQIRGGRIDASIEGGHITYDSADRCVTMSPPPGEGKDQRICPHQDSSATPSSRVLDEALSTFASRFADAVTGIVAVEREGQWYVSPMRTFSGLLLELLRNVERADLEEGGSLYKLFTEGLEGFGN